MDSNLVEHLARDKDNKFHGSAVALRLATTPGMTLSLYLEVSKIWEQLTRSQEKSAKLMEDYRDIAADLRNKTRETTVAENFTAEEIKDMLKGFIAKAFSMDEIESFCIVAKDSRRVKSFSRGSEFEIYGMMGFIQKQMFASMSSKTIDE